MRRRPCVECCEGFVQRSAKRGDPVFHAWRRTFHQPPLNQAIAPKPPQALRQGLLCNAFDLSL
jgi:hypothetical protein